MGNQQLRNFFLDLSIISALGETYPSLPMPSVSKSGGESGTVRYDFWEVDSARQIAAALRLFPGIKFTKNDPKANFYTEKYYELTGELEYGTQVKLSAFRSSVCNRAVTDSHTVVEEVPDPAEVAKLPTVKHERVVETVEWQCVPLLAKAEAVAS